MYFLRKIETTCAVMTQMTSQLTCILHFQIRAVKIQQKDLKHAFRQVFLLFIVKSSWVGSGKSKHVNFAIISAKIMRN